MAMSTPSDPTTPQIGEPIGTMSGATGDPMAARPAAGTPSGGAPAGGAGQKAQETASAVADEGKSVAGTAGEQARSVAETAKTQVTTVKEEAKTQASRVIGDATSELQTQVEQRVSELAEKARSTGDQLRALAEGRTEEAGPAADWARQASERLDQFSDRVGNMGLEEASQEVKRFARQRPMMFLAGAATAGFLLGRTFRNASGGGNGSGGQSQQMGYGGQLPATAYGRRSDLDLTVGTGLPQPGATTEFDRISDVGTTSPLTSPTGEFG